LRSLANQAAQVSLVGDDATAHEGSVLSVDVDNVDAAQAQATGLVPDYDKCQAYIADVHSAFHSGSWSPYRATPCGRAAHTASDSEADCALRQRRRVSTRAHAVAAINTSRVST
jgi:hypothetical protein